MKTFDSDNCKLENPFFIATVEDNNDPTFNYRVKVRHPHFHPEIITKEQLPWAARVDSTWFGMSDDGDISHKIPDVGSQVFCLAIQNDLNSIVYLGSLYKKTNNTPVDGKYLQSYGIYGKNGHFIGIDKIEQTFKLIYEGKINIDKIQEMTINVSGNVNLTANTTNINGNVNISGNTSISGNVSVKGSTTMESTLDVTGMITGKSDVKGGGGAVGLLTHMHGGVFPGPSMTSPGQG